jgi:Uma2 family endonuclease
MDYPPGMSQRLPTAWVFDPDDPRAPTAEQWERMTPEERARVVAILPPDLPLDMLPNEGDPHRKAKRGALDALDGFFRRTGRKVYLSSELAVYYPGEPRFAPDLLAVTNVETHERTSWVVSTEGKGLDFVIEVHAAGDRRKDEQTNVERYARLGIPEYFYYDRTRGRLLGHRLPAGASAGVYQRIVPQAGRFSSEVLGLDLVLDRGRLRFVHGTAFLEDADEMIARLGQMLDQVMSGQEEAARLAEDLSAKLEEEQRKLAEEQRKREDAERALAKALAEIELLRKPDR